MGVSDEDEDEDDNKNKKKRRKTEWKKFCPKRPRRE
jgi:hypothetical protein